MTDTDAGDRLRGVTGVGDRVRVDTGVGDRVLMDTGEGDRPREIVDDCLSKGGGEGDGEGRGEGEGDDMALDVEDLAQPIVQSIDTGVLQI